MDKRTAEVGAGQVWRPLTTQEQAVLRPEAQPPFGAHAPRAVTRLVLAATRATLLRRGALRAPMARLIRVLNGGIVDVRFRGAAFRLADGANLIENGVMLVPGYNGRDIDFLLQDAPADACFVDIGCNVGLYGLSLAVAHPAGRVLAIDANPRMAGQMAWNAAASGLTNVQVVHAAVSDAEGRADLVIRKDDVAIVGIRENPAGAMPVRTLAALVAEAGITAIHGLKIDIEGHEDKALVPFLDGAPDSLLPRRIVIEMAGGGDDYSGCAAAFARRGYRLAGRTRNNSLYLRDA